MRSSLLLLLAGSLAFTLAPQDTEVAIPMRDSKLGARLVMPPQPAGKVPVVIFVTTGDEAAMGRVPSLSNQLASDQIASLRYLVGFNVAPETSAPFEAGVETVAATVTFLRNDARFSTITVASETATAPFATVAARVARADTAVTFSLDQPATVTKAVRDLEAPGRPRISRNMGQRASLRDTVIATVDGARLSVEYGRPSKRGRVIWGNLVSYSRWWMPGADEATTFTTNRGLTIGTLDVPAGDYTIYTQPGDSEFLLIISKELGQFHTVYHPAQDLGRVALRRQSIEPIAERLTFEIYPSDGGGGVLKLMWDERAYYVPFTVNK